MPIAVSRDVSLPFDMTVVAGNEPEEMTLPPAPTMKFIEEARYSVLYENYCMQCANGGNNRSGTLSINLPFDELILPRSESPEVAISGSPPVNSPGASGPLFGNLNAAQYSQQAYHPRGIAVTCRHSRLLQSLSTKCRSARKWLMCPLRSRLPFAVRPAAASIRHFCASARTRFEACADFDAKRAFLRDHVERIVFDHGKIAIFGSVPLQGPAQRSLPFRIDGAIDAEIVRTKASRKRWPEDERFGSWVPVPAEHLSPIHSI
jgi:hypothetical protein